MAQAGGSHDNRKEELTSAVLAAARTAWAFTQEGPLSTADFRKEAEKRRIHLREEQLSELWRVGALAPFLEIRDKPLHDPLPPFGSEPRSGGTLVTELRLARATGRLLDAEELGFRPQLRFFRKASQPWKPGWWNGLLYSQWQLLWLHEVRSILDQGRWHRDGDRIRWRCPNLSDNVKKRASAARQLSALLTTLEARYLPVIEPAWISLTNAEIDEWEAFVADFDPAATLSSVGFVPDDLPKAADDLLLWLDRVDPNGDEWSELIRRAPRRSWRGLAGEALVAMDHRVAAEILLRCYEDLAERQACAPLADSRDIFHSARQRLTYRSQPLDANLSSLGISPHPGVVLVVEGETEEVIVPLVRDHVRIPARAELMQSVVMRGVRRDLTKLAAFASAPLIDRHQADAWLVVKPPTRLVLVVDPDPPFDTPENVETERQKILDEIIAVVRAQGVDPIREDIDSLVTVRTWTQPCFEFAHFTDAELSSALLRVHPNCGGLDGAALESALESHRRSGQDIKVVWKNWRPRVSKTDLGRRLWPVLEARLNQAMADPGRPVPEVADALVDAYHRAAQRPPGQYVLRGTALSYVEDPPLSEGS